MSDIFISYARKDLDKVRPLAEALEAQGWKVWWDPQIRAGTQFDRVIEKALGKTRCVLVVWSQASVDSDWVRAEASYGLQKGFLVSISIERDAVPPVRFLNIHTESLNGWDMGERSPSFDKVVEDLEAILGPLEAFIKPSDLDEMVEVPAGEFIYQNGKMIIETPFKIDVYPVTNRQYEKFIEAGGYDDYKYWSENGNKWRELNRITGPEYSGEKDWNQPDHPIVGASYYEAEAFATWAVKRLPTEKEWERAARGTDGREYPWGNEFDSEKCNTSEAQKKIGKTTPVTRYRNGISPVGCYDMAGNVWEWTNSWFDNDRIWKVLRGGSWFIDRRYAHSAARTGDHPNLRNFRVGFRCARTKK